MVVAEPCVLLCVNKEDGKILWQTRVADFVTHQGFGSSPVVHDSVVLVTADHRGRHDLGHVVGVQLTHGRFAVEAVDARPIVVRLKLPNLADSTQRFRTLSVGSSAFSVMLWSTVKIGVSVVMLMLAPRLVQSLSWPVLLATLVLCMQMYWVALLWRGR